MKALSAAEEIKDETPQYTEEVEEQESNKPKDKLDLALDEFTDEYSPLSLSEKMSNLRSAYMWSALMAMKRIKKHGTKSPISAEEEYKQTEGMKQFKLFERMYESELKSAKMEGKKVEEMGSNWLQEIKDSKSTMGSIVRTMHDINKK